MLKKPIIIAWKWLFSHLLITASLSYFITVLFTKFALIRPESVLTTITFGLRHIGSPILWQGVAFGVDKGVMIFICNLTVALLILSIICWVRLLNPDNKNRRFAPLRRQLQKDRTARHLRIIPYFARIKSYQLRLSAFALLCIPFLVVVLLGIMIGTLLGGLHMASNSSLVAFAFIMPHGIPEITALLLACSIPVAIWMAIQPTIANENPDKAFRRINRIATSQTLQQKLKMIINLLLIAGLIEAHFTLRVVEMVISS